jgi:ATPase subunit of ABC transporter with duplicated ATPase domains
MIAAAATAATNTCDCVQQEERKLDKALRANPEDEQLNLRLGTVHEQLAALGADVAESKARRILHGLGFDEDMQVCVYILLCI